MPAFFFITEGACIYNRYSAACASIKQAVVKGDDGISKEILRKARIPTPENRNSVGVFRLSSGDWFCEPVLWCFWVHRGDVIIHTPQTYLLQVHIDDIESLIRHYPTLRLWGGKHAEFFVESMKDVSVSDLFDTSCVNYAEILHSSYDMSEDEKGRVSVNTEVCALVSARASENRSKSN